MTLAIDQSPALPTRGKEVDNTSADPRERAPLVTGDNDFASITEKVCRIPETPLNQTPKAFMGALGFSSLLLLMFVSLLVWLVFEGIGIWGLQQPAGWGFDITNFVFWIGIGHAGTLISAILFLLRQRWRTAVNRAAEAMTLFAVVCALVFPGFHVGRIWLAPLFMAPIPTENQIWPQFRSPLLWDVFAVSTYGLVSLLFWYTGLIPDLATMRDRAKTKLRAWIYGFFALGWRGSNRHWQRYERAYLILAALSTPLVLSVHSVVSFDFATSILPGWHTTVFPPYFVAGAIFSGFAMVLTLLIPARSLCKLQDIITVRHVENMCKIIMVTGMMVGYAYAIEFFMAWYSGNQYELFTFINRATGPYAWAYWTMVICNVVVPQVFWIKKLRTSIPFVFFITLLVNVGMWFERFVIISTSLSRDFLPSSWDYYTPTWVEIATLIGSFGLFFTLFLLFARFVPMVAIAEIKHTMYEQKRDKKTLDKSKQPLAPEALAQFKATVAAAQPAKAKTAESEAPAPSTAPASEVSASGGDSTPAAPAGDTAPAGGDAPATDGGASASTGDAPPAGDAPATGDTPPTGDAPPAGDSGDSGNEPPKS